MAGVYRPTLSSDASVKAYGAAIGSVQLTNEGSTVRAGVRDNSISVNDTVGLEIDHATVSVSIV